ncbi:hypothetical protein C4J81_03450 [Deltaproteobacteria bacterium Smac51]|nr:hypothetical protein C4J81_03450 [Deltaproteobacteria bacterium Smac51]
MSKPLINFHTYQKAWLKDKSRFKIGMFARQTGKTFTTCAEIVDDCIMAEIENRRARWVILSRGERQAKEAMDEAIKPFCKAFYIIYKDMLKGRSAPKFYKDTFLGADDISYKALEVEFPGGSRITALPANPDTARGFSANTFLDEFAFHQDSRAIWRALFPVISKPGLKLRVTSTPNGKKNKFYDLWTSLGNRWSKHEVDIHKAVELGLDRDIDELREGAGDDDLWRQEFLLKFLDDAGSWLAYDLIMAAEHGEAGRPDKYRGGLCYIGNDIGRRRDLWVAWVIEMVGDVRWTREVVILQNATFPLYLTMISAGWPSPAQDYIDKTLDLHKHLVKNQAATYFLRVQGDSMVEAGINDGSLLVVDRSITPASGKIVIAAIDGELTVKRYVKRLGRALLEPANSKFKPIDITDQEDVVIWGVVTHAVNDF